MNFTGKYRVPLAAVLATLALCPLAFALDPRTPMEEYGRRLWRFDDGLPNAAVRAITQTPDGYLWFGTQDGVARFDGVRFVMVEDAPVMRSTWVYGMTVDAGGALWIGSARPGLTRYRNGVAETIEELGRMLDLPDVFALANGPDHSLWLGTTTALIRRDPSGKLRAWSEKDGLPSRNINALLFDRHGALWVGTEHGLARFADGAFQTIPGMSQRSIKSLCEDASGALWIGTNRGAFCLRNGALVDQPALRDIADSHVAAILEDSSHTMWFGTNAGLKRLAADGTSDPVTTAGIASSFIRTLFEDREHNLWIGTMEGVTQLRDTAFRMYGAAQGLHEGMALTVAQDKAGALWLGFYDALVRMVDGKQKTYKREDGLPNATVISMTPSHSGGIWAGTWGGGICHVEDGARPRCYGVAEGLASGTVRAIYEDANGSVWIGSSGGLQRLEGGRIETFGAAAGLPTGSEVMLIAPSRNGGLWLSLFGEGLALFKDGHIVQQLRAGDSTRFPRCVIENPDGSLWVGYDRIGLVLIRNGKLTQFLLPMFHGHRAVLSIVDTGTHFWVTMPHEVLRLDKSELLAFADGRTKTLHPTECGPPEGLTSTEFTRSGSVSFRGQDGSIWFNGSKGAARLDLHAFDARHSRPPITLIESVTAGERELRAGATVDARGVRMLFRFTAINFAEADQLTFRYKLEGYDGKWNDAGKARNAVYTNLPPGGYVFRVMSAGATGVWNEGNSASFAFSRRPVFTETYWFYGGCAVVLVALGGLGLVARVRMLQRREAVLAQRVREQTASLTELSMKQSTILGTAGDGIVGLDAQERVSFINPSGAKMLGWPVDELIGQPLHDIIHASPVETADPADLCTVCGTRAEPPLRAIKSDLFRSRSGATIPVEYTSAAIETDDGRRIGVVVTFRDITEKQELERLKNDFVSTVSHELRTPLTAMRGALGLLGSGLAGDLTLRAKRMVEIAVTNCDRLVRLINDILDIERFNSGRVELQRAVTEGQTLVRQAAEVMQPMAERAGLTLRVEADAGPVNVDPDRITQVITNLLSNAFKFSPAGATVTVRAERVGEIFNIRVSDEGRGIPPSKLALIFERFHQVEASDSTDKGGTGLGLAICRSIARAHGGDITVESTMGVGSTFLVQLPDRSEDALLAS